MTKQFTDGTALYYVVPNNNNLGNTIVKVENIDFTLTITHECNFNRLRSDIKCRHVLDAEYFYKQWRWWEIFEQVVYVRGKVVLQPDWDLIDDLNSVDLEQIIFKDVNKDVAEHN